MVDEQLFPQLVRRARVVVFRHEDLAEALGERTVEICMSDHVPGTAAADVHASDALLGIELQTPFLGGAFRELGGVVCLPHVRLEGVLGEVVVRRADVGVAEYLAYAHERRVVVARREFLVDDDLHAELLLQVEEELLLVAHDDGDVGDAGLVELAYLSLDEYLSAHVEQALGLFVRDGGEARRHAGGHDDRIVDPVGSKLGQPAFGEGAIFHELCAGELTSGLVCRAERDAHGFGKFALGEAGVVLEGEQGVEFLFVEHVVPCHV